MQRFLTERTARRTKKLALLWMVLVFLGQFLIRFMERHTSGNAVKTVVTQFLGGHRVLFAVIVLLLPAIAAYAIADTSLKQAGKGESEEDGSDMPD